MVGVVFSIGNADTHQVAKSISEEIETYSTESVHTSENIQIYNISYPSYPVDKFEVEDFTIILEGEIYEPKDIEFLLSNLFSKGIPSNTQFRAWAENIDGDYNLYVIDESKGKLHLFTDILNRLPIYWTTTKEASVGGRSLRFVQREYRKLCKTPSLDRMSIAEFLLLGYYLGKRTPYQEIKKSVPASKMSFDSSNSEHSVYNQLSFDSKDKNDKSIKQNAEELANILRKVIRSRSDRQGSNVVSLSGGKDSRLVASTLADLGIDFSGYSYYNDSTSANKDTVVALQIAQELDIDWSLFRVHNSGSSLDSLYRTKGGMNYLAMGFFVEFLQKVASDNAEQVNFYTGDIGDLLDGSWSFKNKFTSDRDAAEWLVSNYSFNSPRVIEQITKVTEEELISEIVSHMKDYPEKKEEDRLQHFLTQERGFNMDFHGEDRNRSYVWTLAPLNAWPVVDHLMSVPKDQKYKYKLTKEVFRFIDESMININYAPYNAPMGTYRQLFRERDLGITSRLEKLKNQVPISLVKDSQKEKSQIVKYINSIQSAKISEDISPNQLRRALERPDSEKYTIMTVAAIMEGLDEREMFFRTNLECDF